MLHLNHCMNMNIYEYGQLVLNVCCLLYMLRPDSQPLTRFETSQPVLKPVNPFWNPGQPVSKMASAAAKRVTHCTHHDAQPSGLCRSNIQGRQPRSWLGSICDSNFPWILNSQLLVDQNTFAASIHELQETYFILWRTAGGPARSGCMRHVSSKES